MSCSDGVVAGHSNILSEAEIRFGIEFQEDCPIYCRTRDKTDEPYTRSREFMEAQWRDCAAFLDSDTLQRATRCMPTAVCPRRFGNFALLTR
jgi:hypothetical protein